MINFIQSLLSTDNDITYNHYVDVYVYVDVSIQSLRQGLAMLSSLRLYYNVQAAKEIWVVTAEFELINKNGYKQLKLGT